MKTNLEALQSLYQIMTGESKEFTTNAEALEQIAKNYSSGGGKSLSVESIDAKIVNGEMVGWDKIKNTSVPLAVVSDVVPYVGSKSVVGGKISTPFHNYKSFSMYLAIQKVKNTSYIYISNGSQGIKIKANVSDKTVSIYDAKIDAWVTLCAVEGYKYLILKCTYSEGKFKLFGTVETVNGYSEYTDEDYNSLPFMYETTEDNLISLDRTYIDFLYDYPRIARFVVNGEYEKTFETSKLYNKKIIFTGDSICKNSGSYATLMENVKKCQSVNFSWGGNVFTQNGTGVMSMHTRLSNVYVESADKDNTDIILLEGGVNDAIANNDIGTLSDDFTTFDNQTFLGALEEYFAEIYTKYPTAKKGFIITYKCSSAPNFEDYVDAIVSACEKWKIPYLNLYNDSGFVCDIADQKTLYFKDDTHINDKGYAMILNKIISFTESL